MKEAADSQFLFSKALALAQSQQYTNALEFLKQLLKTHPNNNRAIQLVGAISNALPDKNESIAILKEFIDTCDSSLTLFYELGSLHLELGNYSEAISNLNHALDIDPNSFESLHDLGAAYALSGSKLEALGSFLKASKINGQSADLFYNLGRLYDDQFEYEAAITAYKKSVDLNPRFTEAWINLGIDLGIFKKYPESLRCFEIAYEQNSGIDFLYGDCLYLHMRMCAWGKLQHAKNKIEKDVPQGERIISPLPLSALIDSPVLNLKAAEIYTQARYPINLSLGPVGNSSNKKIKVGYFSPDFHEHPVSYLMAEVFELHDRNEFEVYGFSFGKSSNDSMRQRVESSFDHFLDVAQNTPQEIASLSRQMGINIAIDLCGFTENARTEIFALRAAPAQISYIGFLGSSGAEYMDYLIADEVIIPPHLRRFYCEKIIYLPSYQANDSKRAMGKKHFDKSDFGIQENQFVFCNLNNVFKITQTIFDSWLRILKKVPNSVMLLNAENAEAGKNLLEYASKKGVDPQRFILAERLPRADYLARYKVVDLFLDTTPYNAGATASDALWMNVPVITLQGDSFPSRIASSLLTHLGLPELIHLSIITYEAQAAELATHPEKFKALKNKLISRKSSERLFNSKLFMRNYESALKEANQLSRAKLPLKDISNL
jgi:predicted O-linked N-acetylglucosamine transferase (SPINDLY family)